jgi:hypothetical protein
MLPLIIFKFPETKGLSLEEIGALFGDEMASEDAVRREKENIESSSDVIRQGSMDRYGGGGLGKDVPNTSNVEIEDVEKQASANF